MSKALPSDALELARIHHVARKTCLPYLRDVHTLYSAARYFQEIVIPVCTVWIGENDKGAIASFIAIRPEDGGPSWIDHLYVDPSSQGCGLGTALLERAKVDFAALQLWTFQRNTVAIRFYENCGFFACDRTDGSRNEEREPDVRYTWARTPSSDAMPNSLLITS